VQLIKQRLRLLEIERIEAFGEPAVDRSEKIAGLFTLALTAPIRVNAVSPGLIATPYWDRITLTLFATYIINRIGVLQKMVDDLGFRNEQNVFKTKRCG